MYGVAVNCACFLELQETRVPNQGAGRTDPSPGYGELILCSLFLLAVAVRPYLDIALFCFVLQY